jgi:flagellar motor switch protein FliG
MSGATPLGGGPGQVATAAQDRQSVIATPTQGHHRVAALFLAMGKPLADRLLKHFSEDEIKRVIETTTHLGSVPRETIEHFVTEVVDAVEAGSGSVQVTAADVATLFADLYSSEQIADLMTGGGPRTNNSVWPRLADVPEAKLVQFVRDEHPQVAAFVLARVGSTVAATVLQGVPPSTRAGLVRRILTLRATTLSAAAAVESTIMDAFFATLEKKSDVPAHVRLAEIMNKMERAQMQEVLVDLDQRRPNDAKLVRGLLFSFDDIERLAPGDRVRLFDGVSSERTIQALNGATPALRELVLQSVSARTRRMIEQELASGTSVSARDVAKAQRAIAEAALKLAEQGQISLASDDAGQVTAM